MKNNSLFFLLLLLGLGTACNDDSQAFDATGLFEADAVIVAAEASGKLLDFAVTEGARLRAGQKVGTIDCTLLDLQKNQVKATIGAVEQKRFDVGPQIAVLREQLKVQESQLAAQQEQQRMLTREQERVTNLVEAEAATTKQLDDINGQLAVLTQQLQAMERQLDVTRQQIKSQQQTQNIQNRGLLSEQDPLREQVALLDEQLERCTLANPINGTVLLTYANAHEMTGIGKPLYKIAPLDTLTLRAYFSGDQLSQMTLNQAVRVRVDDGAEGYREYAGRVQWISDEAEFTPKSIQTKEERANLVFATKIAVPNSDHRLKIGMYGEVFLASADQDQ